MALTIIAGNHYIMRNLDWAVVLKIDASNNARGMFYANGVWSHQVWTPSGLVTTGQTNPLDLISNAPARVVGWVCANAVTAGFIRGSVAFSTSTSAPPTTQDTWIGAPWIDQSFPPDIGAFPGV